MQNLTETKRQQATWECKQGETGDYRGIAYIHRGYGIIEPIVSEWLGYRRALCPCEQETAQQYKETEERKAHQQHQASLKHETFEWLSNSWSDMELATKTFKTFDEERQLAAVNMMCCFLGDFLSGNQHGTLILHGSYGTGKTHLLAALCNAIHEREQSCLFTSSNNLFSAIQDLIGRNESYVPLINKAIRAPLLVLDDIDKSKSTDFRQEIYFSIIDGRVKRNLPTAISTNRLAELENFVGEAVYSRFKIGQIAIQMIGGDYREEL